MPRIYLDACALNRLTDDQSQSRIQAQAEAVEGVQRPVTTGMLIPTGLVSTPERLADPDVCLPEKSGYGKGAVTDGERRDLLALWRENCADQAGPRLTIHGKIATSPAGTA